MSQPLDLQEMVYQLGPTKEVLFPPTQIFTTSTASGAIVDWLICLHEALFTISVKAFGFPRRN